MDCGGLGRGWPGRVRLQGPAGSVSLAAGRNPLKGPAAQGRGTCDRVGRDVQALGAPPGRESGLDAWETWSFVIVPLRPFTPTDVYASAFARIGKGRTTRHWVLYVLMQSVRHAAVDSHKKTNKKGVLNTALLYLAGLLTSGPRQSRGLQHPI